MRYDVRGLKPSRAPAPSPTRPDDAALATKLQDVVVYCEPKSISHTGPTLLISLASVRFAGIVFLSVVVFVGMLFTLLQGVVIDTNVRDALGSTDHVDHWIDIYQVANGFFTALIGMVVEAYFMIFIVVAATFLKNESWFPGDDPAAMIDHHANPKTLLLWTSKVKKLLLWGFTPVVMYNLNVALTAMYVSHQTTGFHRNFLPEDLVASTGALEASVLNAETAANLTSLGNGVSVLDTILRGAVRQRVVPFEIDPNSSCLLANATVRTHLPTVKELRSVSVGFGFPFRDWNLDALPFGLVPTHAFNLQLTDDEDPPEDHQQQFDDFQLQSNVSWLTMYELLLQGKLPFERSVSEYDGLAAHDCPASDRMGVGRVCHGAISSLHDLDNMDDWDMHTMSAFTSAVAKGFTTTSSYIDSANTNLTVEVYEITPQLKLTAMTLDIPYTHTLRYDGKSRYCDGTQLLQSLIDAYRAEGISESDIEAMRESTCVGDEYVYRNPRAACGKTNCIFLDQSELVPFKMQLQLMPYTVNCSTEILDYDDAFFTFFPRGCVQVGNAVFLYGLGSYISAESFDSGYESGVPYIAKPRRHVVFTFAKLEWQFEDLSAKFQAKCGINATKDSPSPCAGLVFDLENVTIPAVKADPKADIYKRVLVLGQDQLPADRLQASCLSPVQLLTLTTRPFYYPKAEKFFEWEYMDLSKFQKTNWPETIQNQGGLNGTMCSGPVDSYISMFEENHLYMTDTRQPLYTAALFYLFQDAAVKTVKLAKNKNKAATYFHEVDVSGTTELKGDLAKNQIRFKIPLMSLTLTFVGLGLFLLLAVLAIAYPTQRLKMVEDSAESIAQKYARFRQEDKYPEDVLDCALKLPTGKRVPLDEYVVDSLTLHHKNNRGKKIYL